MIATLLATSLLLAAGPSVQDDRTQEPGAAPARADLTDVTAQVDLTDVTVQEDLTDVTPTERIPRIHAVPSRIDPAQRARLEATLSDAATSAVVRATAHVEYLAMLEMGTSVERADELAEALLALLAPEFDPGGPDIRSTFDGSGLLVDGTEPEHAAIAAMLASLEAERRQVFVEASIYRLPRAELDRLTGGRSARALDEAEVAQFQATLQTYDRLITPAVVTRPGSKASISAGEQIAYIADFEVVALPERDTEIADPVVKTVFDGILMEVRAAPLGGSMRLDVRFESSELQRPIPTEDLLLGTGGAQVTIQRPVVTAIETSALFDLADDATVALRAIDVTGSSEEGALILLRSRLVEPANGGVRVRGR